MAGVSAPADHTPDPTAVRTALWRALHMLVDQSPPALDDMLGLRIADVDDSWRQRPDMDPVRMSTNRASIVARSRLAEDVVSASGATQYVILGAGLDTFAQRHDGPTQVFEIDAPATSAWKRDRLDALGLRAAERLHLVPVDFEAGESWLDQVVTAGLDPAIPTVVSMLGVTMYLSREAISATLCPPRRWPRARRWCSATRARSRWHRPRSARSCRAQQTGLRRPDTRGSACCRPTTRPRWRRSRLRRRGDRDLAGSARPLLRRARRSAQSGRRRRPGDRHREHGVRGRRPPIATLAWTSARQITHQKMEGASAVPPRLSSI